MMPKNNCAFCEDRGCHLCAYGANKKKEDMEIDEIFSTAEASEKAMGEKLDLAIQTLEMLQKIECDAACKFLAGINLKDIKHSKMCAYLSETIDSIKSSERIKP